MKNLKELTSNRIKRVLYSDKLTSPTMFKQTLKLETYAILKNFMDIKIDDIKISVALNDNGKYRINIGVETNMIKPVGQIIE